MMNFAKVATLATGIVAIGGAVTAWDHFDLPRPAMLSELQRVADQAEDTRVKVLLQQIDAAASRVNDLTVLQTTLESKGEPVPESFESLKEEEQRKIEDWESEIEKLTDEGNE